MAYAGQADTYAILGWAYYISPSAFILIHSAVGEKDQAFAWPDRAYDERDFDLRLLKQLELIRDIGVSAGGLIGSRR